MAKGALKSIRATLEIELNVSREEAGQSFADRNGRGSKKNKNLVSALDVSSALSHLRIQACNKTVFEHRLADGRTTGCTETAISNIVDLSTIEQMLLNATTGGKKKPENLKHYHVDVLLPYAKELLKLLGDVFGESWPESTAKGEDTFRRLYVHGWAFALKAISLAYYRVQQHKLEPIIAAMSADGPSLTKEEAFLEAMKSYEELTDKNAVDLEAFKKRLETIDWVRHRKHWTSITGFSEKDGKPVTRKLKNGEVVVKAQAPNTATVIGKVADLLLSSKWKSLCKEANTPIK